MNGLTPLLNVADAAASIDFYTHTLGFSVERQFELDGKVAWARISNGATALMLNQSPGRARRGPREDATSYDDVVLYFDVDDAPKLHRQLSERGLAPGPCERQDYGVHEFTLRDPDGYELAFGSAIES